MRKPLDLYMVQSATARNKEYIEESMANVAACMADSSRERRLTVRECKWCYYFRGSRLAGQAFTDWSCWACGKEDSWPNTATPRLCNECSDKLKLCVRCGADIELKMRRKLERSDG